MYKYILLTLLLSLSSCQVDQIPRLPLLTPPQGLTVSVVPPVAGGSTGYVLTFTANNPEIFFSGFAVFVSTRLEDFAIQNSNTTPVAPTAVSGTQAQLFPNENPNTLQDTSIFIGAAMAFPVQYSYPVDLPLISKDIYPPEYSSTTLFNLPDGTAFTTGTYYFAVYAFSNSENTYSLPSNIATLTIP